MTVRLRRARKTLKTTTVRDFSGGWNVADNELTLDSRFAPVLDNMHRAQDGSMRVRHGTIRFSKTSVAGDTTAYTFGSVSGTIETTNTSASVEIVLTAPSITFNLGQRIRIAGITTTYGGIVPANLNGDRVVTAANHSTHTYTITAGAAATSTSGPTAIDAAATFSRNATVTTSDIIAQYYFDTYIVTVHESGEISRVDSSGNAELIWDDDIESVTGSGGGAWSGSLIFASFGVFGGPASGSAGLSAVPKLLVHNDTDRGVVIDFAVDADTTGLVFFNDTSLTASSSAPHDSPTGAKYIAAMPEFCVLAGIPSYPSVLAISDQNTPYVWPDIVGGTTYAAGSLETVIDMARIVNVSDPTIRGITRFRDKLVVAFDSALALVSFSVDTSGASPIPAHAVVEVLDGVGSIAHKSMHAIGDDVYMMDIVGIPSLQQALYTGGVRTQRVSQLIDPAIQTLSEQLTVAQAEDFIWSVWNPLESQYMVFVPYSFSGGVPDVYHTYVYTYIPTLKVRAWSRYLGLDFRCGCVSQLGRTFMSLGDEIFVYGTENSDTSADLINSDAHGADGTPINFDWELPWADFDYRSNIKTTKYITIETTGSAEFTTSMYTDNILTAPGTGADAPALASTFIGGNASGFGIGPQTFGGGRTTSIERLWKWPAKFKIMKMRFNGCCTGEPLSIVSFSIMYTRGGIRI